MNTQLYLFLTILLATHAPSWTSDTSDRRDSHPTTPQKSEHPSPAASSKSNAPSPHESECVPFGSERGQIQKKDLLQENDPQSDPLQDFFPH